MVNYEPKRIGAYKVRSARAPNLFSEYSNEIHLLSVERDIVKLIDLFPEPETFGIFTFMYSNDDRKIGALIKSWVDNNDIFGLETGTPYILDEEYVYNRSGSKLLSSLMRRLIVRNDANESGYYPVTTDQLYNVMQIISARYLNKWTKLYETLRIEYDPIMSYEMKYEEDVEDTLSSDRTTKDNDKVTSKRTDNETGSSTEETSDESTGDDKNFRFAFNSPSLDAATPVDRAMRTDTDKRNGTITNTRDATVDDTSTRDKSGTETYSRTNPIHRTIDRKGNIGNITRQKLIDEQRELLKWQLLDVVFHDVDAVLTRNIFCHKKADTRNYKVV